MGAHTYTRTTLALTCGKTANEQNSTISVSKTHSFAHCSHRCECAVLFNIFVVFFGEKKSYTFEVKTENN